MNDFFYKSSGQYLGFIDNENIFSWDGQYLGWIDGGFVWDATGQFRGELKKVSGHNYILKNLYALPPLPKTPSNPTPIISVPPPQPKVPPIILNKELIGWVDGF